jgi:hypothetical protein
VRTVALTQGQEALVDDTDYDTVVAAGSWCVAVRGRRTYAQCRSKGKLVYQHRYILGAPKGVAVDHVNGDGLDNRRANLRLCSSSQNAANGRKHLDGQTSRYKGVSRKGGGKWQAFIGGANGHRQIGRFDTEEEAARAYDEAALALWGEFARPNYPQISGRHQRLFVVEVAGKEEAP